MKKPETWEIEPNRKNALYCGKELKKEQFSNGGAYDVCYLEQEAALTDSLLEQIYASLSENGEVYIVRRAEELDFSMLSLLLIKHGFIQVVKLKQRTEDNAPVLRCVKAPRQKPLLSVIVPLYNEENTAGTLLEKLFSFDWPMDHEFVIVESNSTDKTREIAMSYADRKDVRLVLEDKPSGKGNGVLHGIREAKGQYIAIQDGDLEYDVEDYAKLLPPIYNYETLFVLGTRYRKGNFRMRQFSGKRSLMEDYLNLGQKVLTWIINAACGTRMTDPFTMYKIFHRDCMYGIHFKGGNFGLDWELVIRFLRKGYVPTEIPVFYQARSYAEGKHIEPFKTPIEGLKALWHCRFASGVYDYGDE
ncbi:MAG: glycosyltransferase family 2 protein [Lachnospiraceae bacterium]|nr:glycosyltransferase family 2 protein [Lachnospiraceae bacterium]